MPFRYGYTMVYLHRVFGLLSEWFLFICVSLCLTKNEYSFPFLLLLSEYSLFSCDSSLNEYPLEQLKEKERYDQPWFIVSLFKKRVMINSIVWARKGWKTQERNIIQYKYKLFQVLMNQHNNFNSRSLPIVRYIRSLFLNMLALHSRNYRNWTMLEQCP